MRLRIFKNLMQSARNTCTKPVKLECDNHHTEWICVRINGPSIVIAILQIPMGGVFVIRNAHHFLCHPDHICTHKRARTHTNTKRE